MESTVQASRLPAHPPPPADLYRRKLPIVPHEQPLIRSYKLASSTGKPYHPLHFGGTGGQRFDIAAGVCYTGTSIECAFIETFGREQRTGDYTNTVFVSMLLARGRAELVPAAPLRLVDLTGNGPARLGADGRLCTCDDYSIPQAWALAFHEHPQQPDGIKYNARHDLSLVAVALFRRAGPALQIRPRGAWYDRGFRAELARILDHYAMGLIDDRIPFK